MKFSVGLFCRMLIAFSCCSRWCSGRNVSGTIRSKGMQCSKKCPVGNSAVKKCECIGDILRNRRRFCHPVTINNLTCTCHKGYNYVKNLNEHSILCLDINECNDDTHICSDKCENTYGGYKCSCNEGRIKENDSTCKDLSFISKNKLIIVGGAAIGIVVILCAIGICYICQGRPELSQAAKDQAYLDEIMAAELAAIYPENVPVNPRMSRAVLRSGSSMQAIPRGGSQYKPSYGGFMNPQASMMGGTPNRMMGGMGGMYRQPGLMGGGFQAMPGQVYPVTY